MAHASLNPEGARPPSDRPDAQRQLVELALGAAWLLGLAAVLEILSQLLASSPLAAALAGAVLADLVAARVGVRWSAPGEEDAPGQRARAVRRIGLGAALGALAVLLTLGASAAIGWASVEAGEPSLSSGLALVRAVAFAVRDELLLTGIPLATAARAGVPSRFALAFSVLAHSAALGLAPGATAASFAMVTALGALAAALWHRAGGALAAISAHAAFSLLAGAGLRGALLDVTWTHGTLTAGARAFGGPAWIAAATLAVLAAFVLRAAPFRPGASPPRAP